MSQTPEELAQEIKEARQRSEAEKGEHQSPENAQEQARASQAMRVATDLVSALFVGGFLGYWLDRWWGTKPWMMILFLFIGFAAGFVNIYRSQTGQDYKIGFKDTKNKKE